MTWVLYDKHIILIVDRYMHLNILCVMLPRYCVPIWKKTSPILCAKFWACLDMFYFVSFILSTLYL